MRDAPPAGPTPLLLTATEVDALYDCVQAVDGALAAAGIRAFVLAGSLLGAVRSNSILFCDDDVDIGVLEEDYARARALLPGALGSLATYKARPWPAADKIRPRAASAVWIDLFVLRKYGSERELGELLAVRANGQPQPDGYADAILAQMRAAGAAFPLYHYDNRKAVELWPREFFHVAELLPLRTDLRFGPATVAAPARPVAYLRRAYGPRVFDEYKVATSHLDWSRALRQRHAALTAGAAGAAAAEGDAAREDGAVALRDEHYLPVQHSKRDRRVWSEHSRAALARFVAAEDARDAGAARGAADAAPRPKPSWFGAALSAAVGHSPAPVDFALPAVRAALEPHVAKARAARAAAPAPGARVRALLESAAFAPLLRAPQSLGYDARAHDLRGAFAAALGLADADALGALRAGPASKGAALARLLRAECRDRFHSAYAAFVEQVVAPAIGAACGCEALYAQAFPCVRVICPGEFSIGPHADCVYGFSAANVNVVVPLLASDGAGALVAESREGAEDWRSLPHAHGTLTIFHGARCLHFAGENLTAAPRVSLDFRLIPEAAWPPDLAPATEGGRDDGGRTDRYAHARGYYVRLSRRAAEGGAAAAWHFDEAALPEPDERFGFPFTRHAKQAAAARADASAEAPC